MSQETLNPKYFRNPSLFTYVLLAEYRLLGFQPPKADEQAATADGLFRPPSGVAYVGRLTSALMGVLNVLAIGWIGWRALGPWTGVLGALFLALAFIHVRDSHYATNDVPSVLLLTLSVGGLAQPAAAADDWRRTCWPGCSAASRPRPSTTPACSWCRCWWRTGSSSGGSGSARPQPLPSPLRGGHLGQRPCAEQGWGVGASCSRSRWRGWWRLLAYLAGTPFTDPRLPEVARRLPHPGELRRRGLGGAGEARTGRAVRAGARGRAGLGDARSGGGWSGAACPATAGRRRRAAGVPRRLPAVHAPLRAVLRAVRAAGGAVPLPAGGRGRGRGRRRPPRAGRGRSARWLAAVADRRRARPADARHGPPQRADRPRGHPRPGRRVGARERAAGREDGRRGVHDPRPSPARVRRPGLAA